ncbi:MAG: hypothetical protein KBA58_01760 [Methanomassiliicoccales archaeon]|nr:hypothetical protein [Methanomassiliicoccales archaeon]
MKQLMLLFIHILKTLVNCRPIAKRYNKHRTAQFRGFLMTVAYRTLKVASANGLFQQGMNATILPRAIALQCQLNNTLCDWASLSIGVTQ